MRKTKEQKAITLIALIITIIVLLILALVTIRAVQGDGIINYAQRAKNDYERESDAENTTLGGYLSLIESNIPRGNNTVSGETEETNQQPQIGDKVAYDEGSGKTSSIDTNFVMKDMEWRILDIEEDGTIELISTQPTDSTLTLSGEEGYLNAETNLDTLCNDLYANGEGITARSLKVEDIDKLAGITTDADRQACTSDYGSLWRFKYNTTVGRIQYSKSTDNGETWTNYANTSGYTKVKEPGKTEINSTNTTDVSELKNIYYSYIISDRVVITTKDGISIANLIEQGLNNDNNAASGSNINQWLSSCCVNCFADLAYFNIRSVFEGKLSSCSMLRMDGDSLSPACTVRPVVILPSSVTLTNVDGVWQINV